MTAFIAANDIVQISYYCQLQNQISINVLHHKCTAVTGLGITDQEFADAMGPIAAPLYKAWLPAIATFMGQRVQVIAPVKKPYVVSDVGNGVGAVADEPIPSQSAFLVEKRTGTVTLGAFGKSFLPFWTELHNSATGKPTAGGTALAFAWAAALMGVQTIVGAGGTATFDPVLWSRKYSTAKLITDFKFNPAWATHKSRSQINKGDSFPL